MFVASSELANVMEFGLYLAHYTDFCFPLHLSSVVTWIASLYSFFVLSYEDCSRSYSFIKNLPKLVHEIVGWENALNEEWVFVKKKDRKVHVIEGPFKN